MNEYAAAIGLASLDMWPQTRESWTYQMSNARSLSSKHNLVINKSLTENLVSAYWIVNLNSESHVNPLVDILDKNSIDWRRWWEHGCHQMTAYLDRPRENLLETELVARKSIGLPLHLDLLDSDWNRIDRALGELAR